MQNDVIESNLFQNTTILTNQLVELEPQNNKNTFISFNNKIGEIQEDKIIEKDKLVEKRNFAEETVETNKRAKVEPNNQEKIEDTGEEEVKHHLLLNRI